MIRDISSLVVKISDKYKLDIDKVLSDIIECESVLFQNYILESKNDFSFRKRFFYSAIGRINNNYKKLYFSGDYKNGR